MSDEFELSRRKALAALGTVGVASAGAGVGTSAFFGDRESFENNRLTAGTLDAGAGYTTHYWDWSDDEDEGLSEGLRMFAGGPAKTGSADELHEGEVGLPANDAWLIAVDEDDVEAVLDSTLTSAYPNVGTTSDPEQGVVKCVDSGADPQADDATRPAVKLTDVKPGDFGKVTFDFVLCDNPGHAWVNGALRSATENGTTEPETDDPDENVDVVELLDIVQAAVWVDDGSNGSGGADGNNYENGKDELLVSGSVREVLGLGTGSTGAALDVPLNGDTPARRGGGTGRNCFSAETAHSLAFAWWVPIDHGNEIQTDSVTFDLGLYTEQCRHNDGGATTDPADMITVSGEIATIDPSHVFGSLTPREPFSLDEVPYRLDDLRSPASTAVVSIAGRAVTTTRDGEFSIRVPRDEEVELNIGGVAGFQRLEATEVFEQETNDITAFLFPVAYGGLGDIVRRVSPDRTSERWTVLRALMRESSLTGRTLGDEAVVLSAETELFGDERRIVVAADMTRDSLVITSTTPRPDIYAGTVFDGSNLAFYSIDASGAEFRIRLVRFNDAFRVGNGGTSEIVPPDRFLPRADPPADGLSRQDVIDRLRGSTGNPPIYAGAFGSTLLNPPQGSAVTLSSGSENSDVSSGLEGSDLSDVLPREKYTAAFSTCLGEELARRDVSSTLWTTLSVIALEVVAAVIVTLITGGTGGVAIGAVAGIAGTAIVGIVGGEEAARSAGCVCLTEIYCDLITTDLAKCNCFDVDPDPPCPDIDESYMNSVEAINNCIDDGELRGWGDGTLRGEECEVQDDDGECDQYR
jgi:predicted ribosomally synthesized peptide with SipW-like signal peptide